MDIHEYNYRMAQVNYFAHLLEEDGRELIQWRNAVMDGNVLEPPELPCVPHEDYCAAKFRVALLQLSEAAQDRLIKRKHKRKAPIMDHPSVDKLRSMMCKYGLVLENRVLVAANSRIVHSRADLCDMLRQFWERNGWKIDGRVTFDGHIYSLGATFTNEPKRRNLIKAYLEYVFGTKFSTHKSGASKDLVIDDRKGQISAHILASQPEKKVAVAPPPQKTFRGKGYYLSKLTHDSCRSVLSDSSEDSGDE